MFEFADNKFLKETLSKSDILEKSKLSISILLIVGRSSLLTKTLSK
jgi:hypothetical protein